jgi:hypothetical protein
VKQRIEAGMSGKILRLLIGHNDLLLQWGGATLSIKKAGTRDQGLGCRY